MSKKSREKAKQDRSLELRASANSFWAEIFVLNILAAVPLYLHPQEKYIYLTQHKARYLWTSSFIMFGVLLLITLSFAGMAKSRTFRDRLSGIKLPDWAAAVYLLLVCVSAIASPLPDYYFGSTNFWFFLDGVPERHDGIITIAIYVMIYFTVSRLYRPKERDWAVFAAAASAVSAIGLLQGIGYDIFTLYPYGYSGQTIGVYDYNYLDILFRATLGNVDIISPFVCIVIGFLLPLYMKSDRKIRFLYLAAVILTFAMMIMGGADGGIVGVGIAIALLTAFNITDKTAMSRMFFALSLSCLLTVIHPAAYAARDYYYQTGVMNTFHWGGIYKSIWVLGFSALMALSLAIRFIPVWIKGKPWKAALIAVACVMALAFAGIETAGSRITDEGSVIYQAREVMHMRMDDGFGSGRGFLWDRTMNVVMDNFWLGTGPDTFSYAFRDYQLEAQIVTNTEFDKAHNDYLQILICHGIFALAAFMALLFSLAAKVIPKVWEAPLFMACAAACAAYMVQAFFGISTPMVTPLFFVMLGIVRGAVYEEQKNGLQSG